MARAGRTRRIGKPAIPGSKLGPLPDFVAPCLAQRMKNVPEGDSWLHEIKFDGYRLEARIERGEVRLLTRNALDWTRRFPRIVKALAAVDADAALLDGEVVVERDDGTTSCSELVADLQAHKSARMAYCAFDLLHLNGVDLRAAALVDRKAMLARLLKGRKRGIVRFADHIEGNGAAMLDNACKLGLEGIISKRADMPYRSGRSGDWIKITCHLTDEFVIGGYLESAAQKRAVGALALGRYARGRLEYVGRVGTGFTRETAASLWKAAQPLRAASSPFVGTLDASQKRGVIWLQPELVAQVEYRALTGDGLLRHAAFKGVREDKSPADTT